MYPISAALVMADGDMVQAVQDCLRSARARIVLQLPEVTRWAEFLLQLQRAQPDVVITELQRGLEDVIRRIRSVSQAPVIVMHHEVDAETILTVLRAGAREYVYPPYEQGLLQALERLAQERVQREATQRRGGQVFGVLSVKGGCGATTVACHVAAELRRLTQKEILLAYVALTGGSVGFVMNVTTGYSIMDAARNLHRLDLSYWKGLLSSATARLDVIASLKGPLLDSCPEPESLREVLRFARYHYDWVIADLGSGLNYVALSLMEDLDQILLVMHPEVPAFYLTKNAVQALRNVGVREERVRLVVNRASRDSDFPITEIERLIGLPVHLQLPNSYPELYKAYAQGRLLAPDTSLGKVFARLAMELGGVEQRKQAGRALPLLGVKKVAAGWEGG